MAAKNLVPARRGNRKTKTCLSCGTDNIKPGRRYCTDECKKQLQWVLSLSRGLLRVFNARYAAFSFSNTYVILDILPVWSKSISRFFLERDSKNKPSVDLKNLILQSGENWYEIINNNNSRSYASLCMLNKNNDQSIRAESIKPDCRVKPRFSKEEKESMKLLKLKIEEIVSEGNTTNIKSAYKKLAKIHHPDVGGDAEKFKKLNEAHQQMRLWAKSPQYTSRKALSDCWSYDASSNRWAPPL